MSQSYDITQTAFMFSWLVNFSSAPLGPEAQLAQYVQAALNGTTDNPFPDFYGLQTPGLLSKLDNNNYGGHWDLVWGPGVYSINKCSQRADNTAYVVKNGGLKSGKTVHIVAIAGTDPHSLRDWLVEDFQVGKNEMYNWPTDPSGLDLIMSESDLTHTPVDTNIQQISFGTALGIQALGSRLSPSIDAPSGKQTLWEYLITIPKEEVVIFTGHSLGGALSPTLARCLMDYYKYPEKAGPTIYCVPIAGPTPGNKQYQVTGGNFPDDCWDNIFQPTDARDLTGIDCPVNGRNNVKQFNCNACNNFDVVPHAWDLIYNLETVENNSKTPINPITHDTKGRSYFCGEPVTKSLPLPSQLGAVKVNNPLKYGTELAFLWGMVLKLDARGAKVEMTRSANTLAFDPSEKDNVETGSFDLDFVVCGGADGQTGIHKLQTFTDVMKMGDKVGNLHPYIIDDGGLVEFLDDAANVHVWGYSTAAFGIDFSNMRTVYWYSVEDAVFRPV